MIGAVSATGWYVYGVVGPVTPELDAVLGRITGVDGEELVAVGDDVAAVVGRVGLGEFGEDALREHLNDRVWLEEKARAHGDVLARLASVTAVAPLRFGTIYNDEAAVRAMLDERRALLDDVLRHVRGRVELGVKVWLDRRGTAPAGGDASSGRAYLERRREEQNRARAAAAGLEDALRDVHSRLLAHAVEGVVNRPQPRELAGRDDAMVLNAAYLVPAGDESLAAEAGALAAQYQGLGLSFEVTGPWPAHNFVDLELAR